MAFEIINLLTYLWSVCRRNQFEQSLLLKSWRINFDDIELVNSKGKSKDASVSNATFYNVSHKYSEPFNSL